jgi:WD40 repeat protein
MTKGMVLMQNHTIKEFPRLVSKVAFLSESSGLVLSRMIAEDMGSYASRIETYDLGIMTLTDVLFESTSFIHDFAVSSNNLLAVCLEKSVVVIDIATKSSRSELSLPYMASSVCFSSDGRHLVVYGIDNYLWHLDLASEIKIWQQGAPTFEASTAISFHPNNTSLVIPMAGQGGSWLSLSNLKNGFADLQSTDIKHDTSLLASFSPDGNFLCVREELLMLYKYPSLDLYMAFNGEGEIDFPTSQSLEDYAAIPKISHWSNPVFCSKTGRLFCKVSEGYICAWNFLTGEILEKYLIENTYSDTLAISDNGKWIAASGNSRIVEMWKVI